MIREVAELHLLLEMPKAGRVVLQAFKAVGLCLDDLAIHLLSLLVLGHLKVAPRNLSQHPPGGILLLSELSEDLDALLAFVET